MDWPAFGILKNYLIIFFFWNHISLIYKLEKSRWQSLEVWQTPKQAISSFLVSTSFYDKKRSPVHTSLLSSFDNIYLLSNQLFSDFVFQCCWMASTWTRTSRIRSDDYLETSRLWKIHHGKLQEVHVQSSSQYSSTIKQQLYCNRIIKSKSHCTPLITRFLNLRLILWCNYIGSLIDLGFGICDSLACPCEGSCSILELFNFFPDKRIIHEKFMFFKSLFCPDR